MLTSSAASNACGLIPNGPKSTAVEAEVKAGFKAEVEVLFDAKVEVAATVAVFTVASAVTVFTVASAVAVFTVASACATVIEFSTRFTRMAASSSCSAKRRFNSLTEILAARPTAPIYR